MRCLYCGKQLALFRRLTGSGEFCSDAHKQSYHEEYNRLALTRLIAAQTKSEEMKISLKAPSTMQLATGDRKPGRALEEGRGPASNQRWTGIPVKSRALEAAPAEQPPPASASFFLTRPEPAEAAIHQPETADFHKYRVQPEVTGANWIPDLAHDEAVPPQAGLLESTAIPIPASPLPGVIDISPPGAVFLAAEPALGIGVPIRPIAGLQPRPPVAIDFMEFAPKPRSKPAPFLKFEDLRFAVMVFGTPSLEVIPEGLEIEPPNFAPDVEFAEIPEPMTTPVTTAAPQSSQADIPAPPSQTHKPDLSRQEKPVAKPEKPGPKLPTIPAARRKTTPMIPSIVQQPAEPTPEPSKSLWGVLRKYMKK